MIFVYNFLQVALLLTTFPLVLLIVFGREKYRTRIGARLGARLKQGIASLHIGSKQIIWIHSLSVGEVTSALPLVQGIRREMEVCIVFSATTRTGMKIAREKISPHVDLVIPAPLDLLPVVSRFVRLVKPDIFILVETDFWPNWLHCLRKHGVPSMLVNGRISRQSFARYQRFSFFCTPMFNSFSLLAMQTEHDASQMKQLGISADRIKTLGNLKYDTFLYSDGEKLKTPQAMDPRLPQGACIWVCGSTHPGEEEVIIQVFSHLLEMRKDIFLILAPRDPGRCNEIRKMTADQGLQSMRRTAPEDPTAPILILDTIGELAGSYSIARVAFIGGSLIDCGGHNPLEAAAHGTPVLFGPHMEDFLEIARDLEQCGGALTVDSAAKLEECIIRIIDDPKRYQQMSEAARSLVKRNSGVIRRHVREIRRLLAPNPG